MSCMICLLIKASSGCVCRGGGGGLYVGRGREAALTWTPASVNGISAHMGSRIILSLAVGPPEDPDPWTWPLTFARTGDLEQADYLVFCRRTLLLWVFSLQKCFLWGFLCLPFFPCYFPRVPRL